MQDKYAVTLEPGLSQLWRIAAFQINFNPTTQRLISIEPTTALIGTKNVVEPKLVAETRQALDAFTKKEWQKVDRWLESIQTQLEGTAFQVAVWKAISQIPAGKVATYQDLANQIGRPRAVRAVGTACGDNRFPFLIPCHRVVSKNGLGGYGYGIQLKQRLLQFEVTASL